MSSHGYRIGSHQAAAPLVIDPRHYADSRPAPWVVVAPPAPPGSAGYTVPGGGVSVTTGAQLATELAKGVAGTIILADGTYDQASQFVWGAAHRVWAASLGGAVLTASARLAASNAELHGVRFDVSAPAKMAFSNSVVQQPGSAAGATIEDCWIYGNNTANAGIRADEPSGLKARRIVVRGGSLAAPDTGDLNWYGVFVDKNDRTYTPAVAPIIEDVDISGILDKTAQPAGTVAFGLWVGSRAVVNRITVKRAQWSCYWMGTNANDSVWTDIFADGTLSSNPGIYVEHYTRRNTVRRFKVVGAVGGIVSEWNGAEWAGTNPVAGESIAAGHFNTFEDGLIDLSARVAGSTYGAWVDQGTEGMTLRRVKVVGVSWAGVVDKGSAGTNGPYGTSTVIDSCDFSKLGAVPVFSQTNPA